MVDKIFHKVGEVKEKPMVLIIGEDNFMIPFLTKALGLSDCQTIFFTTFPGEEILKKSDYIFYLKADFNLIKEIFNKVNPSTKILFALSLIFERDLEKEKLLTLAWEKKINLRIVLLPEVYGPGMDQAAYQQLLKLDSPEKQQAIFISDFIYALLKAMFGLQTKGQAFSLKEDNETLGWQKKILLDQGLAQMAKSFEPKKKEKKGKLRLKFKPKMNFKKGWLTLLIFLLIILIFSPLLSLAYFGFFGLQNLKQTKSALLAGQLIKASRKASLSQDYFQRADQQLESLSEIFGLATQEKVIRLDELLSLGSVTAEGVNNFLQAALQSQNLLRAVMQKQAVDFNGLIEEIKVNLDRSFSQLSLAESQLGGQPEAAQISQVRQLVLQARKATLLLPEMIGLKEKQTYLVLFQNNSELRPTGGFIGSFGLLTFDEGQLIDFEVKDVYSADGQLKGHVEPPADLKKYLGEAGWYLRDSNWDPDFPTSAARAAWFLEKETGRRVNGVWAINLSLAQQVLKAVGEIQIPDYQEKINADNFFEKAEYYSEINFFPGSTQKQDFLGGVSRVLFEKLKTADDQTWLRLVKNLFPSLKAKDCLVWLSEPSLMAVITELGWEGRLKEVQCSTQASPGEVCFADFLMLVEANVGINKANYFLKRSFSHQIEIGPDWTVGETLRLDYQNTSATEAFPGGRYKAYLRVYTPLGSELKSLKITDLLTGEVKEPEKEFNQQHGKEVFGFLLEVPIQERRSVEITWQLADKISPQTSQYLFFLQKQPGVKDEAFSLWLKPPLGISVLSSMGSSQTSEGIFFNPNFDQDLMFEFSLVR